jgi:diketogulonate reductase-like aldo/keto reductase
MLHLSPRLLRFGLLLVSLAGAPCHGAVCDGVDRPCPLCRTGEIDCSECIANIACVTLNGGVRMPVVGLGTGASAYATQCDEPLPNPPFVNEDCFKEQAALAAKAWVLRGGALVETAQDDLNQVPVGIALKESGVNRSEIFVETKCMGSLTFEGTLVCVYDALQMLQVE